MLNPSPKTGRWFADVLDAQEGLAPTLQAQAAKGNTQPFSPKLVRYGSPLHCHQNYFFLTVTATGRAKPAGERL